MRKVLNTNNSLPYIEFRDASIGVPYTISLMDCLNAIYKAYQFGFFNFDDFDFVEYEHFEVGAEITYSCIYLLILITIEEIKYSSEHL